MERLPITEGDQTWLQENYPSLTYTPNNQIISGELHFSMYYSADEPGYVLHPDDSYASKDGIIIQDVYEIEVDLSQPKFLPPVRELGGRIFVSKEKWDIENIIDLHLYSDGTACLCPPSEIPAKFPNGFDLRDFIEDLIVPFFYYQSFFEKYGREPWKAYSHGYLGILESYYNDQAPTSLQTIQDYLTFLPEGIRADIRRNIKAKGHHLCKCGSGKKFRKCHQEVLYGYNKLREDYHLTRSSK